MSIFLHRTKQLQLYGSYGLLFKLQLFSKFDGCFYVLLDLKALDFMAWWFVLFSYLTDLLCYSA